MAPGWTVDAEDVSLVRDTVTEQKKKKKKKKKKKTEKRGVGKKFKKMFV